MCRLLQRRDRAYATVYPDGSMVKVAFNGMGLPNTLCDGEYNASAGAYFCTSDPFLVDGDTDDNLNSATGVDYNELGQATEMRFPAGGGLWRHNLYYAWDDAAWGGFSTSDRNRRLADIRVGTSTDVTSSADSHNRLRLRHFYDSHGNLDVLHEQYSGGATDTHSFAYDDQNRLTAGFGSNTFAYDSSGRLEFFGDEDYTPLSNAFPVHAVKGPAYDYDANGNMIKRDSQTLTWDHENRLASVSGGATESYLYDADGMRVKKTSDGVETYYPFPHYELHDGVAVKYYFFGGMRIAQRRGSALITYLHGNHLGSTVLETSVIGVSVNDEKYFAYGEQRDTGPVNTENQYTDQKRDDTGLYYYKARYYDPALGTFISPDTIVPQPTNLFDYNRMMYVRGNPLRYTDPNGYYTNDEIKEHFECESWGCVERQFSRLAGDYYGLDKWLSVLMSAEDGYIVTSHHPTVDVSWIGIFARNPGTGKIQIFGGSGAVNNRSFAQLAEPSGTGWYEEKYTLMDQSGQDVDFLADDSVMVCDVWDCRAVGYSAASFAYSAAGDAGIICTAVTSGACGPAAIVLKAGDAAVTIEAARYTAMQHALGNASDVDLAVSLAETGASVFLVQVLQQVQLRFFGICLIHLCLMKTGACAVRHARIF